MNAFAALLHFTHLVSGPFMSAVYIQMQDED